MIIDIDIGLQDENIHRIQFSELAQIGQIYGIEYLRILIFEFQLHKLSLRDFLNILIFIFSKFSISEI